MSQHLPLLQALFPGELTLGVEQIAQVLKITKQRVYDLRYENKLPFKLISEEKKHKILVSIVEMAHYLDSTLTAQPQPSQQEDVAKKVESHIKVKNTLPAPKKLGRPRINRSRLEDAFMSQLSIACQLEELEELRNTFKESNSENDGGVDMGYIQDHFEAMEGHLRDVLTAKQEEWALEMALIDAPERGVDTI